MENAIVRLGGCLECPICKDTYTQPVTLPCQHDYCFKCVEKVVLSGRKTNDLQCVCPTCKHQFHVTANRLPRVNTALAAATDIVNNPAKAGRGLNRVKRAAQMFSCSTCKRGMSERANLVQTPCGHIFCLGCLGERMDKIGCSREGSLRAAQVPCSVCSCNITEFIAEARTTLGHRGMGPVLHILRDMEQIILTEKLAAQSTAKPLCVDKMVPRPSHTAALQAYALVQAHTRRVQADAEPPEADAQPTAHEPSPAGARPAAERLDEPPAKRSRKSPEMFVNVGATGKAAAGAAVVKGGAKRGQKRGSKGGSKGGSTGANKGVHKTDGSGRVQKASGPPSASVVGTGKTASIGGLLLAANGQLAIAAAGVKAKGSNTGIHKHAGKEQPLVISGLPSGLGKVLKTVIKESEKLKALNLHWEANLKLLQKKLTQAHEQLHKVQNQLAKKTKKKKK